MATMSCYSAPLSGCGDLTFESLPVELIAEILGELDLESLVTMSYLSRRLRTIASDSALNPWRRPILCNLRSRNYELSLKHLSVRSIVPRQNWIEILSLASPSFILYEATLPNLKAIEWEECFKRRFLPGLQKWKKDGTWKEAFLRLLYRVWHRSVTSCTSDEAWTTYIVLNRNGTANELEHTSRALNPLALFNEMKLQSNLAHLETRIRLVVEFADLRILAFGTLNRPRSNLTVNVNAHLLLHPPGVTDDSGKSLYEHTTFKHQNFFEGRGVYLPPNLLPSQNSYTRLTRPLPALSHANYPHFTPGGGDKRWISTGEEEGLLWVGPMMLIAQIMSCETRQSTGEWLPLQDLDLVIGLGRQQYASFTWIDLWAVAPWMEEKIVKKVQGPGLGV